MTHHASRITHHTSPIDILGLGAVAVDDFIYVDEYPPADAKAQVIGRKRSCGGLAAIALITAARLGARCAYAGVLGEDDLSRFVLDCLSSAKVDVAHVKRRPSARPVHSNIVVDQQRGTRSIYYDLDHVVGASMALPARLISACRVLLVDNIGVRGMIRAARLARQAGIPVVADFESDRDPNFQELLRLSDHLIVSLRFAKQLTGERSPQKTVCALARAGHEVTIVTCGEQGCWYMARNWDSPEFYPAFKVKPVDTTGCGDVFHGAYAFGLARGQSLEERVRLASATAALKAKGIGIPSLRTVRRFLAAISP